MADSFEESIAQAQNRDTLTEDMAANQWEDGDTCGEKGCPKSVHLRTHPRDGRLGLPRHPDAPEKEYVCPHHGVVASS